MVRIHSKFCPCNLDSKTRSKTFLPQLVEIAQGDRTLQRRKLKKVDDCLVRFLADASGAVLRTDIKLPQEYYSKITPYRDLLLFLAKKKPSIKEKRRRLMKQKGGAVPLLGILATALTSALGSFAGKALADSVL